jgi:hypothetical protein
MLDILIQPIEQITGRILIIWYLIPAITAVILAQTFGDDEEVFETYNERIIYGSAIIPAVEEFVFRIGPALLDMTDNVLIALSILWLFAHGKRALYILPLLPLFIKLTLGGQFGWLLIIHAVHNFWVLTLDYMINDR